MTSTKQVNQGNGLKMFSCILPTALFLQNTKGNDVMTFKNILTGVILLVFLMLSSCAVYPGYGPAYPYDHSYYHGFYYDHDGYYDHEHHFDYDRRDYDHHGDYDHQDDYDHHRDYGHNDGYDHHRDYDDFDHEHVN